MLDIRRMASNKKAFVQGWVSRGRDPKEIEEKTDLLLQQHKELNRAKATLEDCHRQMKSLAKQLGERVDKEQLQAIKKKASQSKEEIDTLSRTFHETLLHLPNLPLSEVPVGKDSTQNIELYRSPGEFAADPEKLPHWELAKRWDWIDFEAGSKIAGSGFPVFKNEGARLVRHLIEFFLERATQSGYEEVCPPLIVNENAGTGTGQLPDKDQQMYHLQDEGYYLIPTAEVPVMNLYRESVLPHKSLPKRNVAYTPCFRREAGSWGRKVRGLNRLHQFDKVEITQICLPDASANALNDMCEHIEGLLKDLELPYRKLLLCTGDMGFSAAITYDYEVYSSAQGCWLEVSSVSNCTDFQTRRMQLRYKDETGKNLFPHSLNGSALALPRIIACLMEDRQDCKDSILHLPLSSARQS